MGNKWILFLLESRITIIFFILIFREYYFGITANEQAIKEELLELGMGLIQYPWHPKNSPKLCQEAFFVANNWVDEGNGEGYPGEDCNEFEFTRS